MPIHNSEIAKLFNRLADLLEIEGDNPFRVRAYRAAAQVIEGLSKNVSDMLAEGFDLTELPHIGKDLAEKIKVIVKTGSLPALKKVEKQTPAILSDLLKIEGLGPKRVQRLYKELRIRSITDLKRAISNGKLRELHGFGAKVEEKIKAGILHVAAYSQRFKFADALPIVESLLSYLKKIKTVSVVEISGSYRRKKETVGDLDVLVIARDNAAVIEQFMQFPEIAQMQSEGTTRASARLHSGMQVDLRVMAAQSYGAAQMYFTGSKEHNLALRRMAIKKKLKINEYGIYKGKKLIAGKTEKEMYAAIDLPYIEPELREDRGEIAAAQKGQLPNLINLQDIRGDLHCHTNATDGANTLEAMAEAAVQRGYEYIAITDHSKRLTVAHGLDKKAVQRQIAAIDRLNAKLKNIVILKSIELDILEDGTLDLPDDILKELDLTVCSIHSKFDLPEKKQTERIIRAMDNRYFNIFSHPTGRLIGKREPYVVNIETVIRAAKERYCILELNAQPERLDLNDINCKLAKDAQVKIAISTDAHSIHHFDYMQFGINQARRGWLTADDVLNTRNLTQLRKLMKRV